MTPGNIAETGSSTPMLALEHVTVRFSNAKAIDDVTVSVGRGEWVSLIGANGAGKTTLLRAIARLVPHHGQVRLDGRPTWDLSRRRLAQLVAYVPQKPELPPDMSVLDYTLLGRTPHISYFGTDTAQDRRHCVQVLDRLDLAAMAGRTLATLSGGELQRVVLARALAQNAAVLLLDEPTSALDLGRRVDALELVDELRAEMALTVVSALHDLTLAGQFSDRLVLMSQGLVVSSGPPRDVLLEGVLARHFGGQVRVLETDDGDVVVVPCRAATAERTRGETPMSMRGGPA